MRRQIITGLRVTICLLVVLGVAYPLAVWGVGQVAFASRANGSLVKVNGHDVGSALIGQAFSDAAGHPLPQYFQPRPSAAGKGYDASSSGASNLGPSNPTLLSTVAQRVQDYRTFNQLPPTATVPVDAVTASGSGLDPDISEANALDQAPRVAAARHADPTAIIALVHHHVTSRAWGFLGENTVNVLDLNVALDRTYPAG